MKSEINKTENLLMYESLVKKEILSQEECLMFNDLAKLLMMDNKIFMKRDGFEVLIKVIKNLDIECDKYEPYLRNNDILVFENLIGVCNVLLYGKRKLEVFNISTQIYDDYSREIIRSSISLCEKIINAKRKYSTEEELNNYISDNMKMLMPKKEVYLNINMFTFFESQLSKERQIDLICNKIFEYRKERLNNNEDKSNLGVLRIPRRIFYYNVLYVMAEESMPGEYILSKDIFLERLKKFLISSQNEEFFSIEKVGKKEDFDIEIKFKGILDKDNQEYLDAIGNIIEKNFRALIDRFEHSPIIEEKILREMREVRLKYKLSKQDSEIDKAVRNKFKI